MDILSHRLSSTAGHAGDGIAHSTAGSSDHPASGLGYSSRCIADGGGDEGERVLITFRHLDNDSVGSWWDLSWQLNLKPEAYLKYDVSSFCALGYRRPAPDIRLTHFRKDFYLRSRTRSAFQFSNARLERYQRSGTTM